MADDSDAQLEQRVEQVEQQLSKMLPGRRGVLKGLGAAALGGAAVGGATGGASGQTGPAGRQGTPENPNDMFAWDLDVANEVVTDLDLGDNELRSGSVSTNELSNVRLVSADDSNLQAVVDELWENGGGTVLLMPGVHDRHSYPISQRSGVRIVGWGAVYDVTGDVSKQAQTAVDAGGGRAFEIVEDSIGVDVKDLVIRGSLYKPSTYVIKQVDYHNLSFYQSNGRGLEIEDGAFNLDIQNVGGDQNAGATIYLVDHGQAHIRHPWSYGSGDDDGFQMLFGGGTTLIEKPYTSQNRDVDGIHFTSGGAGFSMDVVSPFVEKAANGLVVKNGCNGVTVYGGNLAPGTDGSENALRVGSEGSGSTTRAFEIKGTRLESGGDEIVLGTDAFFSQIGHVRGEMSSVSWNDGAGVSITDNGYRNYLEPFWMNRGAGNPIDITSVTPPGDLRTIAYGDGTAGGTYELAFYNGSVWNYTTLDSTE